MSKPVNENFDNGWVNDKLGINEGIILVLLPIVIILIVIILCKVVPLREQEEDTNVPSKIIETNVVEVVEASTE